MSLSHREHFSLVGPAYPFRGGIAHYTTSLYHNLRRRYEVSLYTFTRQYPAFLFPGRTDLDPSTLVTPTPAIAVVNPLHPLSWQRLWRLLRSDHPDVVLLQWWSAFWAPFLLATALAVKRWIRADLIYICHNLIPHEGNATLNLALARWVLRPGDGYLVHSRWEMQELLRLFPGAKVRWTPIPGDLFPTHFPQQEEARQRLGFSERSSILLFFGFVRAYKGLPILLQAMAEVAQELDLHLIVAGEFWVDERDAQKLVRDLGLERRVTFIGHYIPNEQVGLYFAAADVVVLPYLSASQSAVTALSLHFGRPVIVSDVCGLADLVEHGQTGLLVPPGDPLALSQAIRRYFDEGLGPLLIRQIQERIRQGAFRWPRLVETLAALRDGGDIPGPATDCPGDALPER